MDAKVILTLAARNVARQKVRSGLALAAIAAGVIGLILSGGFVRDLIFKLGEAMIHSRYGHVQIARAGYFEFGSRSPAKYLVAADESERLGLGSTAHVREVMRRVEFSGLLSNGRSSYPIAGEGIEPDQENRLGTYLVIQQGRALTSRDRYGALVGAGVARAMDLKPGSAISVLAPTVDGAMNTVDLEVVGIFQSFAKDYDDRAIKVSLQAAQELLNAQGINVMVLLLDDTGNTASVARTLAARLKGSGLELKTWDQLDDFYGKTVALYDRQFGVLRLIVLVMVLLAVAGAINVGVLERAGEFGTMRALGNATSDVFRLVLLEGALTGALGALTGVLLGAGIAWSISSIGIPMPPPPNSTVAFTAQIDIDAGVLASAFAVGVLAALFASIAPALRVSRLPMVEALRRIA